MASSADPRSLPGVIEARRPDESDADREVLRALAASLDTASRLQLRLRADGLIEVLASNYAHVFVDPIIDLRAR